VKECENIWNVFSLVMKVDRKPREFC